MGTRAFSHDSIFIPDGQVEDEQESQATPQDHSVGKVKSLQQQLGKNIRFGQPPPANVPLKRMQDLGATQEETQNSSMDSLGERDVGFLSSGSKILGSPSSHGTRNVPQPEHKTEEKVTPVKSSRTKRPSGTIDSINLDVVPRSAACLDNTAAKHKLSVKPKNQRVSKKHRGMSQDCYSIEDNEHETGLNVHRSLNKAMYHSMDISNQDIIVSNYFERKACGLQIPEHTQVTNRQYEGEKHKEPITFKSEESRQMDKGKKSVADKRTTEEEQRRQEIIRNIELERLQHKIKEQKENEMKEQRRREEEKKLRAEQILKELEEDRKQDEQRQREEERCLKLAEEQKTHELEQQRTLQQAAEQKKIEIEQQMEQQKALQDAEEQKRREVEKQNALQLAEERKMCEKEEQRALQEVEELNKRKLEEQRILKMAEEQRNRELEQQKALEIAEEERKCEMEQQKTIQMAEEQIMQELEQQKTLKITEEQRKHEQEHQKALQIALEQRKYEMEQQNVLQIEEQKRSELELQRTSQMAEGLKKHKLELQRSLLVGEEIKHDLEEHRAAGVQKGIEVEDQKAVRLVEDKKLVHEEPLKKEYPINEDIKKNVVEVRHSSPDHESSITEKHLPEKLKTDEISKENDTDLKQRQSNEELRWNELDQRQRPFTFKVTSGEKQIIFEKVNLSPVTLVKEQPTCPDRLDPKETKTNISSHVLPSSQCIPHTAILVTGAQLCGTAVNLNQIRDTACKTLLGLTEERKLDLAETKNERDMGNTKYISSKTKYTSETLENQSFMEEWASIRSKIFNKSENVAMTENNKTDPCVPSDDWIGKGKDDSHNILRKTMSASAKFSITPAWQKFPESAKTVEFSSDTPAMKSNKEHIGTVLPDNTAERRLTERALSVQEVVANKMKRQATIEGGAEGCIFSKDLPSFLVPYPPPSPRRGHLEEQTSLNAQMANSMRKPVKLLQSSEEKMAPFGVKLRRTHYSLRFHSDPQNEQKRKKRYSAGDSFEGVPTPLTAGDETEIRTLPNKELSASPTKLKKDSTVKLLLDTSNYLSENIYSTFISPLTPGTSPHLSSPNKDRIAPKSPIIQKPSLAPKPSSPTPPSSPLSKLNKTDMKDPHGESLGKTEQISVTEEVKVSAAFPSSKHSESLEYDRTDKANLPSIPWREKPEKRPEKTGRERPVLQSRHSLDGTRLMEKVESAQPLWITLALQKQKGFREQQASREERRQAREAKQADKLAKETSSGVLVGEYRSRSGSLQKPLPHEEKKCETVVTRLQRREQLQKSNTLPTSVTVEITETVPVTHAKDLPKRFSTPDATPVSSEPAWLALAKRKSKAWSDCPQIIK
ncbi:capping protein inhibiting regulator of actin dynamics isoform X1 [Bufo bufo]|uniref:capping protein inhibiting regulator of actin dynamics isoform X1 n=1 Tax=Bufo bufo TaxID=8384 RepID=UPI001ABE0573|nr:capping protein inhibiting regulator of actin dynamics isoform X1 [Bufo bufo]